MDEMVIYKHKFPVVQLSKPIQVKTINRHMISFGIVAETTGLLLLQLGDRQEVSTFYIITSP
jgi:hypothetical protein